MKKVLMYIGSILVLITVVLLVFGMLSWYNFGDIPTKVVLIRMIICFCVMEGILVGIITFFTKKKITK